VEILYNTSMRLNFISALHLEFADLVLPGGDVLVLSGDICEAKRIKSREQLNEMTGDQRIHSDRYIRFLEEECTKYRQVIYVMGNHEHYGFQYHKTYDQIKSHLPDNVRLLEQEAFELDGVLFLGATLWTDMNNMDSLTLYHMKSMMNDYRQITMFNEAKSVYHKLTPEHTVTEHIRTKQYFQKVLEDRRVQGKTSSVVVCTHHAPSRASIKPRYLKDTIMTGADS